MRVGGGADEQRQSRRMNPRVNTARCEGKVRHGPLSRAPASAPTLWWGRSIGRPSAAAASASPAGQAGWCRGSPDSEQPQSDQLSGWLQAWRQSCPPLPLAGHHQRQQPRPEPAQQRCHPVSQQVHCHRRHPHWRQQHQCRRVRRHQRPAPAGVQEVMGRGAEGRRQRESVGTAGAETGRMEGEREHASSGTTAGADQQEREEHRAKRVRTMADAAAAAAARAAGSSCPRAAMPSTRSVSSL